MDFDTGRLRAFLQIAERGTVASAAEALGYTAPAVSQQLSKLERQLGASLFDRVGGRLRLSARGESLVPIARQILDLSSQAEQTNNVPGTHNREVVVSSFASAIRELLIPVMQSKLAKRTRFVVREAEDEVALRDLRLGDIDLAIVQEYEGGQSTRSSRLTYTPILQDRLRLLAHGSVSPSIQLDELATTSWLVNGAGTRCEEATQQILRAAGIVPKITGHVGDNHTLLALVAAGHGATITPELVIASAPPGLTVAKVNLGVSRTIFGVTRTAVHERFVPVLDQLTRAGKQALRAARAHRP